MNKIIFIEPKAPDLHIFSHSQLPRLGCFILGTIMKNKGWDVEIIFEEMEKIDFRKITSADIVGISTITSTAPRAYAIAEKLKTMGIPTVMGGPHVTYLPDEGLEHSNFVIRGEGEKALVKFIDAWMNGQDFSLVPGLSFRNNGKTVHNPIEPFPEDLDNIPFPDFSLMKAKLRKTGGHRTIPILTSRGCPHNCTFCSVTGMFGRRYRFRSMENIMQEMRYYNHPENFVFFYDDNFTADRRRIIVLLKAMIKNKIILE